ncbi:MAG: SDR family NAD(P)-dependent oxidoreductase [Eubacteriales bacterium]|nr:SDR family NAD(P)-dependent oxidoreductase [Eubacteriales bacterium]
MKNVMVTGGAGFIGCYLCKALLEKGLKVVCVDNLQRGNEYNIRPLMGNVNFTFVKQDATNQSALEEILEKYEIDFVFHLAANTDLWESMRDPEIEHVNTFLTTKALVNAMKAKGVKDIFFSSTSAIYGEQTGEGFKEDDKLFPISYYGAAKMASEAYIYAFAHMNDFNALIFRFSNIIGGKMTHGVIRDFILRLNKEPNHLDVRGNGYQTKPYCHVTELIRAIMMLAGTTNGIQILNVGATTCTNVRFIAKTVAEEMGFATIPINYEEQSIGWKGDVAFYEYNVDKANDLGWKTEMTSDESIKLAIKELVSELKDIIDR